MFCSCGEGIKIEKSQMFRMPNSFTAITRRIRSRGGNTISMKNNENKDMTKNNELRRKLTSRGKDHHADWTKIQTGIYFPNVSGA